MNIALCIFYWVNKHFRFRFRFNLYKERRIASTHNSGSPQGRHEWTALLPTTKEWASETFRNRPDRLTFYSTTAIGTMIYYWLALVYSSHEKVTEEHQGRRQCVSVKAKKLKYMYGPKCKCTID